MLIWYHRYPGKSQNRCTAILGAQRRNWIGTDMHLSRLTKSLFRDKVVKLIVVCVLVWWAQMQRQRRGFKRRNQLSLWLWIEGISAVIVINLYGRFAALALKSCMETCFLDLKAVGDYFLKSAGDNCLLYLKSAGDNNLLNIKSEGNNCLHNIKSEEILSSWS